MHDPSRDADDADALTRQAAFLDFLARLAADRDAGSTRDLAAYQSDFPELADEIARQWPELSDARPQCIGPYTIEGELGRGGQGRVYLARDPKLDRRVALKVLRSPELWEGRQLQRLRREAEVAARIDHPGICTIYDTGTADGVPYVAMQWIQGETLGTRIRDWQRAPQEQFADRAQLFIWLEFFERSARALHAAHGAGILHRDLKPGNLMVTRGGDPVVLDFGLARDQSAAAGATLTLDDEVFGTPEYMAPEQLRGEHARVDARSDVYALGVTMFETFGLQRPFHAASRAELFQAILEQEAPRLSRLRPELPRDLCTVIETAMQKDRDRRYRSALELAEDLRRIRAYEPIHASAVGPLTRGLRWCQRNRAVASMSLLLFAVLAIALTVSLSALSRSEADRQRLQESLADIQAGKLSRRQLEIRRLLVAGYQSLYSADTRKAQPRLQQVLELEPGNVLAIAGLVWHEHERPARALAVLERCLEDLQPIPADLHWLRAAYLERLNRSAAAAEARSRAGELDSALRLYFRGFFTIGGFLTAVPRSAQLEAFQLFEAAIRRARQPQFQFYHSRLMTAARMRDRSRMDQAATDLSYHWPDAPATHESIVQFYLPIDRPRAMRSIDWLVAHTQSATPHCALATDAQSRGELQQARSHLDRGIRIDPGFAPAYWMRGQLALGGENWADANADFIKALQRDPAQPMYAQSLLQLHRRRQTLDQALSQLQDLGRRHPGAALIWSTQAEVLRELGHDAEADQATARARELDRSGS